MKYSQVKEHACGTYKKRMGFFSVSLKTCYVYYEYTCMHAWGWTQSSKYSIFISVKIQLWQLSVNNAYWYIHRKK